MNYAAVAVAAIAAFVASAVWYISFGKTIATLHATNAAAAEAMAKAPAWKRGAEIARDLVIALVLAHLLLLGGIADWSGAVQLGLWLWVGFPVVLLLGSVMYEALPLKLAAIHSGDWLVKLLLMTSILGAWRA